MRSRSIGTGRANSPQWDLPPVIDCEPYGSGSVPPDYATRLEDLATKLEERFGVRPIIYIARFFAEEYLDQGISKYPLFIASYNKPKKPGIPKWWTDYVFWQAADRVSDDPLLSGYDVIAFKGGPSELAALSTGKK
jgi:lysozyme